jgi:hypothetical protein
MVDVNLQLRTSYFSLIAGNIIIDGSPVPLYYSQVPAIENPPNPDNYLLLTSIFSTDTNDDLYSMLTTIIQFTIVTKMLQNNAGAIKDSIASQLYGLIFPNVRAHSVQITSGQVFDTKPQNDIEQTSLNDGEKKVINRIISFRHLIRVDDASISSGNIYYGVQDTNADPSDFSLSINQDGNLPISIDFGFQDTPLFYWLAVPEVFTQKTDWQDLNDAGNSGKIDGVTDLFEVRALVIGGDLYALYMTRYETGFNGHSNQVKFY